MADPEPNAIGVQGLRIKSCLNYSREGCLCQVNTPTIETEITSPFMEEFL